MHVLLHISDIHLGADREPKPAAKVVAALQGMSIEPTSVTLVLTGDVAYSGKTAQYEAAGEYLSALRVAIATEFNTECQVVACPGNHDCDFPADTAVRDLVVESIRSTGALGESQDIIRQCVCVQEPFFRWAKSVDAAPPEEAPSLA